MIPVTLSTGSIYTYGTARLFELAARTGFDGLELMIDHRWDTRQAAYLCRLIDQYDVPVLSVHSPLPSARIAGWSDCEVERIKRSLSLAEALGARVLNVHLPSRVRELAITLAGNGMTIPIPIPSASQRTYAQWLLNEGLDSLQAISNVEIVIENLPKRTVLGRPFSVYAMNSWEEMSSFPRICLDTTHCATTGSDVLVVLDRLSARIAHVHLSDYDGKQQHLPIGRGFLPLEKFLESLAAREFTGVVVVELHPATLPVDDEQELVLELRRNVEFCRRHLNQSRNGTRAEKGARRNDEFASP